MEFDGKHLALTGDDFPFAPHRGQISTGKESGALAKYALVCDDDRLFTLWLSRMLKEWDWQVSTVSTLDGAKEHLNGNKVDLLVLDFHLGDAMACELHPTIEAVRKQRPMGVIMVSAASREEIESLADASFCDLTLLHKPLDIAKFRNLVEEAVPHEDKLVKHSQTYLIVESGGIQSRVLGRMLQESGEFVIYSPNIEHALVLIRNVHPDAIFIECEGSAQDIEKIASHCREKQLTQPPIIVLASVINQDLVQRLIRAGAIDVLIKPFSVSRLHETLARLDGSRPRDTVATDDRRKSVMIVEDFTITAKMYERMLQEEGYRVHVVRTAEIALEMLRRIRPDLLLLDINLPGMSGITLLEKLVRNGSALPTIVVSGERLPKRANELQRLGVARTFVKPVEPEELTSYIAGLFSSTTEEADAPADYDVLIALADEAAGLVLSAALDGERLRSKVVVDGYLALGELRRKPRAVILDIVIRGLDGTEILRRSNGILGGRASKVLAVVDEWDEEIAAELKELGADDSIGKPYSIDNLLAKLRCVLSGSARGLSVEEFAHAIIPEIKEVQQNFDDAFFQAARRLGHNLKGTAELASLPELTKLGRVLEDSARAQDRETCDSLLVEITKAIEVAKHSGEHSMNGVPLET